LTAEVNTVAHQRVEVCLAAAKVAGYPCDYSLGQILMAIWMILIIFFEGSDYKRFLLVVEAWLNETRELDRSNSLAQNIL
jgi:hypothetical protein